MTNDVTLDLKITNNYDLFKKVLGNRQLKSSHVKDLVESMKTRGFLIYQPIIVNDKYEIVDGQHRLAAAQIAKVHVYFTFEHAASLNDVITLNTLSKSWTLNDYLESFIQKGNQNYVILKDFITQYAIGLSKGMELLGGDATRHQANFKRGGFRVADVAFAKKVVETMKAIRPYTEDGVYESRDFSRVIVKLLKNKEIKMEILIHKISKRPERLGRFVSTLDGLRIMEEIYNLHKQNRIRFF